jgi:16S rRNA (uracil1498-N3)-methyltransferase
MSERYFVASPIGGQTAQLSGPEAHHLVHVMRAKSGGVVVLFDGSGAEFPSRIARVDRQTVTLEVLSRHEVNRELPWPLMLGVALPKGERQRWLVEKAVELGVTRLVPLQTARAVAQPLERVLERLRRTVVEAAKQCGRNRLMDIAAPQSLAAFLEASAAGALRLLADPDPAAVPLARIAPPPLGRTVAIAIGPEGGFDADELQAAVGWQRVSLGPRVLRVETAALAAAAWVSQFPASPADASCGAAAAAGRA